MKPYGLMHLTWTAFSCTVCLVLGESVKMCLAFEVIDFDFFQKELC